MGSIGGLIGIGSSPGSQGLGFSAQSAALQSPTTNEQAQTAYDQSQSGIAGQQAFLQAIQAQGGLQNQSDVYNQLSGVAQGTGPNPAQAMLANATGQNTANQAALMAGQRGAGANVGLIARQAAQQGAVNQQNAIGQGAALQANQSLNAIGQMGNIAGQQVANQAAATGALTGAQQGEQGLLLNAIQGQNNASVANQKNINDVNSGMAQSGGKAQLGLLNSAGAAIGMAQGGQVQHLAAGGAPNLGAELNLGQPALQMPASAMAPRQAAMGSPQSHLADALSGGGNDVEKSAAGIGSGIGKGLASLFGKSPDASTQAYVAAPSSGPSSQQYYDMAQASPGKAMTDDQTYDMMTQGSGITPNNYDEGGDVSGNPMEMIKKLLPTALMALSKGGKVPAMVSPGEIYLPPEQAEKVAKGKKSPMEGERIKGKAKVAGNDLRNDTVPKTLEEGGIVIPRSASMDKDKAAAFVAAHFKRKGLSRG